MTHYIDRPETLIRADLMLKWAKNIPVGVYPIADIQVDLVKLFWWELHNHCKGYQFSFNDSFTKLKKYEATAL